MSSTPFRLESDPKPIGPPRIRCIKRTRQQITYIIARLHLALTAQRAVADCEFVLLSHSRPKERERLQAGNERMVMGTLTTEVVEIDLIEIFNIVNGHNNVN